MDVFTNYTYVAANNSFSGSYFRIYTVCAHGIAQMKGVLSFKPKPKRKTIKKLIVDAKTFDNIFWHTYRNGRHGIWDSIWKKSYRGNYSNLYNSLEINIADMMEVDF